MGREGCVGGGGIRRVVRWIWEVWFGEDEDEEVEVGWDMVGFVWRVLRGEIV